MRQRGGVATLLLLAAVSAGCPGVEKLRNRLGLDEPAEVNLEKSSGPFPAYVLDAFPEAKTIRVDPASPHFALATEKVLTGKDPHRFRGPPRFSPDGRMVSYEEVDAAAGERWIEVRKLDGTEVKRVRITPPGSMPPISPEVVERADFPWQVLSWAPSSDSFAYTRLTGFSAEGTEQWELALQDLSGEPKTVAGPAAVPASALWSPAGDRVLYVPADEEGEIWAVEVASRKAVRLVTAGGAVRSLALSADGKRLAFTSARGTRGERNLYLAGLSAKGRTAGSLARLTDWSFQDISPAFSPDGSRVAFFSSVRAPGAGPGWSLMVVDAEGNDPSTGAALLERIADPQVEARPRVPPSWTADGERIGVIEPQTEEFRAMVLVDPATHAREELQPDTITNEDLTISPDYVIAWRARLEWGDHVMLGLLGRGVTRTE